VKRVTQKEVARSAGVSRATVSYVLSDAKGTQVSISRATRERVLKAASDLGYEPDASAQSLRSGKSRTIGVLVPDMNNPHYWQLLSGIEREAHANGYTVLTFHSGLIKSEEDVGLRELARRKIDGLILISSFPPTWPQTMSSLGALHRPVVDLSNVESPFDRVVSDYRVGTHQLMEYLIDLGHRRVGFVYGVATPEVGLDRLDPYREALQAHGIRPDPSLIVECGTSIGEGHTATLSLLRRRDRPTAIIAINDLLALAALRAAADCGLSVPADVSIAGFDDIPFSSFLTPRLTSVHRDTESVGEHAVRLLLERMANAQLPRRTERVSSHLITRDSTGPASAVVRA
jgi:LacI family transcriptional regulator, galactose operon repressor